MNDKPILISLGIFFILIWTWLAYELDKVHNKRQKCSSVCISKGYVNSTIRSEHCFCSDKLDQMY